MPALDRSTAPRLSPRALVWLLVTVVGAAVGPSLPAQAQTGHIQFTLQGWWRGETNGFASSLTRTGTLLAVANGKAGTEILDVSDPTFPRQLANHPSPGEATRLALALPTAAVVGPSNGLQLINLSNPNTPQTTALFAPGQTFASVALTPNHAYLTTASNNVVSLLILDVSNPADPTPRSLLPIATNAFAAAYDVQLAGTLACVGFATENAGGLALIDVADPARPLLLGQTIASEVTPYRLAFSGNRAFVADPFRGLRPATLENPAAPALLPATAVGGQPWGIRLSGAYAFLALDSAGFCVYNVANPAQPLAAATSPALGRATDLLLSGDTLAVAAGDQGVLLFHAADLPLLTSYTPLAGNLQLAWNAPAVGLKLQRATDPTLTSWQDVPGSGSTNRITLPMTGTSGVFRVVNP